MNKFNSVSPRQRQVEYLKGLYIKIEKASPDRAGLYNLLKEFQYFCANLKISNSFSNVHNFEEIEFDNNLKEKLLSQTQMAIATAGARQNNSSHSLNINNSNQQSQVINNNIVIEAFRKNLTDNQFDELMEMINNKADKKSIIDKIREFGLNVTAGILSSIISSMMI